MDYQDKDLRHVLARAKTQGFLTYDDVNAYLPDEDVSPQKLDNLLLAIEERGIQLVERSPHAAFEDALPPKPADVEEPEATSLLPEELPKLSDDPIRMYLSQMSGIPLLTRDEEISLAKKIEVTRKRFRRTLLNCNLAMRGTVDTLSQVHEGKLPFDRTIKVSLTERLTKEQVQARMPHNLPTIHHLMQQNQRDFARLTRKSTANCERAGIRRRLVRNRRKCLQLTEELSLRTRRVNRSLGNWKNTLTGWN